MFPPYDYFDHIDDEREYGEGVGYSRKSVLTRCKHCGSTDVRWRQQGGKWVLFSSQPGVAHACPRPTIVTDFG